MAAGAPQDPTKVRALPRRGPTLWMGVARARGARETLTYTPSLRALGAARDRAPRRNVSMMKCGDQPASTPDQKADV